MELNWSTFLLEIINFLVLVWILKRFLYRPVLDIIEKRREGIEQTRKVTETMHADAEALQQQYEGRLADWEREKQEAREILLQEIQTERKKRFDQLSIELASEREKASVVEQRRQTEQQQQYQKMAMRQGTRFAAKILHAVSTAELENKLIEFLITELSQLSEERKTHIRKTCDQPLETIIVSSAYQLNDEQQKNLKQALRKFCDSSIPIEFEHDADLVAGLRITLGSWILRMNLQDELDGFATLGYETTTT